MDGIKIFLRRNRIVISGYTLQKGTPGWLPNVFCVWNAKAKKYEKDKRYSYLDEKTGDIIVPRTADIAKITSKIRSADLYLEGIFDEPNEDLVEYREFTTEIRLKDGVHPKNEFQVKAVDFLTLPIGHNMHYRLLSLPTGEGKTFCALFAISKYNRKVLIVADSLVDQWVSEILAKLDVSYKKIYEIKDSIKSVEKLLHRDIHHSKYDIYIASLRTLLNAQEKGMYEPMCRKLGIGLKIVDEIHRSTYSHLFLDMCVPIQETIYLSATSRRSSPAEDYTYQSVFKNLPSYGEEVKELLEKYLNVIYVEYDSKPPYYVTAKCQNWYGFQTAKFAEHIFSPQVRNIIFDILKYVIDVTINHVAPEEKIVIIFERLVDVKLTTDVLKRLYPNIPIGDYTSNVDKKDKIDNLKNKIILTTDESFGLGSDLKGLLRVLVNTTTYSSSVKADQQPGRLRNLPGKSVYYIDLVDQGFKRTIDHFRMRSKIINKYAAKVEKRVYGVDI